MEKNSMLLGAMVNVLKDNELEKLSKTLRESPQKEAREIIDGLPPEKYGAYLMYISKRSAKAHAQRSEECYRKKGCPLSTQYDTEHP